MASAPKWRGFVAGALLANGLPHLATGATGRRMMTPFGRHSSPGLNLAWSVANLAGGCAVLGRRDNAGSEHTGWDERMPALAVGASCFCLWAAVFESRWPMNWAPGSGHTRC